MQSCGKTSHVMILRAQVPLFERRKSGGRKAGVNCQLRLSQPREHPQISEAAIGWLNTHKVFHRDTQHMSSAGKRIHLRSGGIDLPRPHRTNTHIRTARELSSREPATSARIPKVLRTEPAHNLPTHTRSLPRRVTGYQFAAASLHICSGDVLK